jgi:hypothetical protein
VKERRRRLATKGRENYALPWFGQIDQTKAMPANQALITTPTDTDAYKFSMAQYALHQAPTAMVEYKFVNRSPVDLRPLSEEITP